MRNSMGKRVGLAGAGAGNDEEWSVAMLGGAPLVGIELVEIGWHGRINRSRH